jgi:hypothetical protein
MRGRLMVNNTYDLRHIQTTLPAKRIFLVAMFFDQSKGCQDLDDPPLDVLRGRRLKERKNPRTETRGLDLS